MYFACRRVCLADRRAAKNRTLMAYEKHWLPGFNFNVEEWDAKGQSYETQCLSVGLFETLI
jgi:hypothetical protein